MLQRRNRPAPELLPGQYFDSETGLHQNYFRDYDPKMGRYIQADPIGLEGGMNLYPYAENSPVNFTDISGLTSSGGPYHPPSGVSVSCSEADSCSMLEGKMQILMRMINSHTGWDRNVPPPRGGGRHSDEIADLWRAYANCQKIHLRKCKDKGECDNRSPLEKMKDAWNNFNDWMQKNVPQPGKGKGLFPGIPPTPWPIPVPVP